MPQRNRTRRRGNRASRSAASLAADFDPALDPDAMNPDGFRAWDRRTDLAILRAYATYRLRVGLKARCGFGDAVAPPCSRAECLAAAQCAGGHDGDPGDTGDTLATALRAHAVEGLPPCLAGEIASALRAGDPDLMLWAGMHADGAERPAPEDDEA